MAFPWLAVASAGSDVFNFLTSGIQQKTNNHYSRELMRYQTQLQHDENQYWADYNTPANQMARLEEAGLNPNLVYGNGADAQFSGSVSPSAQSDMKPHKVDFLNLVMAAKQIKNIDQQNSNLKADELFKKSQASYYDELAAGVRLDNREKDAYSPEERAAMRKRNDWNNYMNTASQTERNKAEVSYVETKENLNRIQYEIMQDYGFREAELRNYVLYNQGLDYQIKNIIAGMEANSYEERLAAQLNLTAWQAKECKSRIAVASATIKQINALTKKIKAETDTEKQKKLIAEKEVLEHTFQAGIKALEFDLKNFGVGWQKADQVIGTFKNAFETLRQGAQLVTDVEDWWLHPLNTASRFYHIGN